MAILPIYTYDQSVLRRKAKPVSPDAVDRKALLRLTDDMFETMHHANGIGLAANQVGSLDRVVVIDVSDMEETKGLAPFVLLNPVVVVEQGSITMEEGCLSIPEIREDVDRPERVRIRFKDLDFVEREIDGAGILARVLQHEIDHLNGILFIDRIGSEKRKLLRGRLNRIQRGEIEVNYPVVGGAPAPHKVAVK